MTDATPLEPALRRRKVRAEPSMSRRLAEEHDEDQDDESGDEENDEDVSIARATKHAFDEEARKMREELAASAAKHRALEKQCAKARVEWARLQNEFEVISSGSHAMWLHAERVRYAKKGAAWWLTILVTLAFTAGTLQRGSYQWAALNFFAFLFVWRGLYVESNKGPVAVALLIAAFTINFG